MNKTISYKLAFLILTATLTAVVNLTITLPAFATYLTINGSSSIVATVEDGKVKLSGTYQIENNGDEKAQNVFPSMRLGKWAWAGEPHSIEQKSRQIWPIEATFALDLLRHVNSDPSAEQELPTKGQFPLVIHRHYEDLNGVHFSAADVLAMTIGSLTEEELSDVRIPQVNSNLQCEGNGKNFTCTLDIRNLSDSKKKISVDYHTSQELQIKSPPQVVDLETRGQKLLEINVENIAGLSGSGYAVFAILQWSDNGISKESSVARVVNIKEPDHSAWWIGGGMGAILLSVFLLYYFVFRNPKKSR